MWSRVFEAIEYFGASESQSLNDSSRRLQRDIGDTARSNHRKLCHFTMFVRSKQFFYCGSQCGTTLTSKDVYSAHGDAQTSCDRLRGRLNFARWLLIFADAPSTPVHFMLSLPWLLDLRTKICGTLCMNKSIFPQVFALEHTHTHNLTQNWNSLDSVRCYFDQRYDLSWSCYKSADKSLARPGRKQATATEDFDFHIPYL